jgi:transcriptional regulator with XRE-family HTH domain
MLEWSKLMFTAGDDRVILDKSNGSASMEIGRRLAETPDGVNLGERIKGKRETLGISQRQLASRIGVHHSYLARLEAGDYSQPAPTLLHRLAEALDLVPEDLFALAGHTIPHELPSFTPYLRAKYHISDEAAQELTDYFNYIAHRYAIRERTEADRRRNDT